MRRMMSPGKNQVRQFFDSIWAPFFVGGFIILLLIAGRLLLDAWITAHTAPPPPDGPPREKIQRIVSEVLVAHEVRWESAVLPGNRWRVLVPTDLPRTDLYVSLQKGLLDIEAGVVGSHDEPETDQLNLDIGWEDSCLMHLVFVPGDYRRRAGDIAILIDDFGDRSDAFAQSFLDLDANITISVIPGLPYSREMTARALAQGREVIMHLPMEPLEGAYHDHGYTLITEMSREQVQHVFRSAMKMMPGVSGVNNHMGSKVTADRRIMSYLMQAIERENLYFIDSRTTAATVAYDEAIAAGIRCAKRDVFLDTDASPDAIRQSMVILARKAEEYGNAIGIGHCYRNTLEVLREEIPKMKDREFRFVRMSQVVR